MLRIERVSLGFRGVRALQGIDLQIKSGELLGLIGPNGSGKSTLFNVITGIYKPDSGQLHFQGHSIAGRPPAAIVRLGIARTFQNKRLFAGMTALENVTVAALRREKGSALGDMLGLASSRAGLAAAREKAEACLERTGIADLRDIPAGDLPYGAQNRLELARALALEPRLLLLDEPAAGLNPAEREVLRRLIAEIHDSGVTVALVEHDVRMVMGLCTRVIVLDEGRRIADGPPAEVARDPEVIEAYFGTPPETEAGGDGHGQ